MDLAPDTSPNPRQGAPEGAPDGATDDVAQIVAQWRRERPDLDVAPMLVVGRIFRLAHVLDGALRPPFAAARLHGGDFDVLAALRRAGAPYLARPHELSTSLLVTTGAITKRLDRLEAAGLVERRERADDGRGKLVRLTAAGLELTDRLMEQHLATQRRLLAALTLQEAEQLQALLGLLSSALEGGG